MANQPAHEWNASVFHEAAKAGKATIALARKVLKNSKSANPQILSLDDPLAEVVALSGLTCILLDALEDQGVVSRCSVNHNIFHICVPFDLDDVDLFYF
jgi:hypothetical protein